MNPTTSAHVQWTYAPLILIGVLIFLTFRPTTLYNKEQRSAYLRLQTITLLGALLGAKLAVLLGDALWPIYPIADWHQLFVSGRSIVGALLFGFLTAEACKPLLGYTLPPNDRFAVVLPFSIAIGRVGCWLSGCCLGVPMHNALAVIGRDGVPRFPAPLAELGFHAVTGIYLIALYRKRALAGRLFALYLVLYGIFRFGTEYLRVTEKAFAGFSAYQWLSLLMALAGIIALWLRRPAGDPSRTPFLEVSSV